MLSGWPPYGSCAAVLLHFTLKFDALTTPPTLPTAAGVVSLVSKVSGFPSHSFFPFLPPLCWIPIPPFAMRARERKGKGKKRNRISLTLLTGLSCVPRVLLFGEIV